MKIYDIKILKSTTGKEYIKFFFKTFRSSKSERKTEIEKFERDIEFITRKNISDKEMEKYNDEKSFISKLRMSKIIEKRLGNCRIRLYKNSEALFYIIENITNETINFEDEKILFQKEFFFKDKYRHYIIIKNNMGG